MSLILRSGLDDSMCRFQFFPFENDLVREMMKSHSVLGLVIRLIFRICISRSSFNGMRKAIDADIYLSFISKFCCVFVCTCVSESASTWRFAFCTFGNMPIIA